MEVVRGVMAAFGALFIVVASIGVCYGLWLLFVQTDRDGGAVCVGGAVVLIVGLLLLKGAQTAR